MKKIQGKNQKGGLLIEALAILGIVAMTSPMIYKKKIDKAQELEDIAKASQIKIIREATNNYVDANYNNNSKISDKKIINLDEMADFLPPGFSEDGNVRVGFRVVNDVSGDRRVNAIIVDGDEYNEKRGNRIASLIGADGGYSDAVSNARGSNDIWSFDTKDFGITTNSQIVATTAFSKSAATGEYLYKYKIEGQPHVNRMMTNVDMGGNNANRLGQDFNNIAHAGLKYGRDDAFNSWDLNGQAEGAQQFGDGSIGGKNRAGDATIALQTSRTDTGSNGVEGSAHGSGALILTASNQRGCTEALSRGNIGVGNDAGVFTACNNNGSRTAYLVAKGAMEGGELRLRTDGSVDVGTTGYSNKSGTEGATFDVTDGAGQVAGSFNAERTDVENSLHYTNANRGGTFSTMELKQDDVIKATGTADETGGMLSLRDNTGNQSVRFTGEEALALTTVPATGHAGLTGDYKRDNQGTETFSEKHTTPTTPNPRAEGAMFVRSTDNSATTAMIAGQSGGTGSNLTLNRAGGVSRGARATSTGGGALYMINTQGAAKVSLEGDRNLGTLPKGPAGSGYAEVRNSVANTAAEMYSSVSGDLSGTSGTPGAVDDKATGGGAYIGYNAGQRNVKFMGQSGYSTGKNTGGTLELTDGTAGTKKSIVTATMPAINDGSSGSSKTSAAMKLVQGGNYAQASADANYGGGEFALQNGGAIVANALSGTGSGIAAGGQLFITGTAKGATSGNVEFHGSKNNSGQAIVRGSGTVTAQAGSVLGTGKGGGTVGLMESQAYVRETGGGNETGVAINKSNTIFYRPKTDADGHSGRRSVYASGGTFLVGQHKTPIDAEVDGATPEGGSTGGDMLVTNTAIGGEGNIKGVILVRKDISSKKVTAPIVKTGKDMQFDDICIQGGGTGSGKDSSCLLEAAAAEAGGTLELLEGKNFKTGSLIGRYKPSVSGETNKFGAALWQLVASRIVDFYDSPAHNDTHHLKSAWGGKVNVQGDKIGFGTASYNGKVGTSFDYITTGGTPTFKYSGDTGDVVLTSPKNLSLSYWNIEKDAKEELNTVSVTYRSHASVRSGVVSGSGPKQYSAAGHGHGATDTSRNKGFYPIYSASGGSGSAYKDLKLNSSADGDVPNDSASYAAKGSAHYNYENCGEAGKYVARRITFGVFDTDAIVSEEKTSTDRKCGPDFKQGSGVRVELTNNKWNSSDGMGYDEDALPGI